MVSEMDSVRSLRALRVDILSIQSKMVDFKEGKVMV